MTFEKSIDIQADENAVFTVYKNVSAWSVWDPETEDASIDGEFVVGARGRVKPQGAPTSKMEIIEVTENKSFTVECRLPLCRMHFVHLLQHNGNATNVTNKIEFSGLLGPLFSRIIGKQIEKSLPASLSGLKHHVEKEAKKTIHDENAVQPVAS